MSPDRDDDRPNADDVEAWEEEASAPLLSRMWVRVALVVVVVGAIAAIATPYVLTSLKTPPAPTTMSRPPSTAPTTPVEKKPAIPPPTASPLKQPALKETQPPARAHAQDATARKQEARSSPVPSEAAAKTVAKKTKTRERTAARTTTSDRPTAKTTGGETGEWWVQVGAFRDPATAKRVAARLESQKYRVEQSTTTHAGAAAGASRGERDRYDVFVAAATPADAVSKLAAKGLSAEAQSDGAIVKPSLSLRDAVTLSKDLASEGFKVHVKRARGADDAGRVVGDSVQASTPETLHRVRIGAFADRTTAVAALKRLEAQGYTPFIAREAR